MTCAALQEVERLVCGNPNLDFDALERNSKYEGGFSPSTLAVQWLWDIVKTELTFEEKKMFLKFFTGSDRCVCFLPCVLFHRAFNSVDGVSELCRHLG